MKTPEEHEVTPGRNGWEPAPEVDAFFLRLASSLLIGATIGAGLWQYFN
jgi:hypothetical protein